MVAYTSKFGDVVDFVCEVILASFPPIGAPKRCPTHLHAHRLNLVLHVRSTVPCAMPLLYRVVLLST
jgi:hypothetical protein